MSRSLVGKLAVVTGANSGVGLETTRLLLEAGAEVVMACRNIDKAETARAGIGSSQARVASLDLADSASIGRFADELAAAGCRVDLLVNNAGVMATDASRTNDGFEMQFGTNHLGHFALTGRLLPIIAPDGRIVSVSSLAHRQGRIDLDDPHFERRPYGRWDAYGQSKLANLLFAFELDRRLRRSGSGVLSLAAHPGVASTGLGRDGTSVFNAFTRRTGWIRFRGGASSAAPSVLACTDPAARGGNYYGPRYLAFGAPVVEKPSQRALDTSTAERLWALSQAQTGVDFGI